MLFKIHFDCEENSLCFELFSYDNLFAFMEMLTLGEWIHEHLTALLPSTFFGDL